MTRTWHICAEHRYLDDPPCTPGVCVALCYEPMRGDTYRTDEQVGSDGCRECRALDEVRTPRDGWGKR